MCGIAGIYHRAGGNPLPAAAARMGRLLEHRGPDDFGEIVSGQFAGSHCRLAILDTSQAGHQPFVSPDGAYALLFNGEIYNYKSLRQELEGIEFQSSSDTEVLLHLLITHGERALPKLKGMFAFAFWNRTDETLLLARDPFGKKPLYYGWFGDTFLFASEVKSFFVNPDIPSQLDKRAAVKYFAYEYVPAPATGFSGIKEIPMGHYLKLKQGDMELKEWWKPQCKPQVAVSEKAALSKLDDLLRQSIERRLVSDVPVGVFLSGGLDSTTIAWYMKQFRSADLHSCSISFQDQSFDESTFASLAAESIGTIHHDQLFTVEDVPGTVEKLAKQIDVPLADASLLPTYTLSKLAKQYMTVVLDGDGSDELFGGYGTFKAAELADKLSFIPKSLWSVAASLAQALPVSHRYFSFDFKLKSFLRAAGAEADIRNQLWLGSFAPEELEQLLTPEYAQYVSRVFEDIVQLRAVHANLSLFNAISDETVRHYLHNSILVKLDRATMLHSLEARTPFLDVDLAEYIMSLPVNLKREKYLLKKLMRGRIPDAIIDRPKKGFGIPLGAWLQGPLYSWAENILSKERIDDTGVVQYNEVVKLFQEHAAGKVDHRKKLWTLIIFQLWYENWIQ